MHRPLQVHQQIYLNHHQCLLSSLGMLTQLLLWASHLKNFKSVSTAPQLKEMQILTISLTPFTASLLPLHRGSVQWAAGPAAAA